MQSSAHKMLKIAKVLKSNGTEGEIVISFLGILPEDIDTTEPVFIFFDGLPVPFYFESLVKKGNKKAIARMTGIRTLADADEISGADIYADEENLDIEYNEDDLSFLTGWKLADSEGNVKGSITGFLDIPENPCLEVLSAEKNEVLVPVHEDLIINIDDEREMLVMRIPDGLFPSA